MKSKQLKIRPEYEFLGKGVLWFAALALLWLIFGVYINSQREAIAEAILLNNLKTAPQSLVFVSIVGKDPSNNFIRRLNARSITVIKPSQGIAINDDFGDSWGNYYVDRVTGKKGKLTQIGRPEWVLPIFVRVEVSYPGTGESFSLRKSLRGWSVTSKKMSWIA